MSLKQLKRLMYINKFATLYPKILKPVNYAEFAILDDSERDTCLLNAENLIKKVQAEISANSQN